ncbi:MAG: 16S rRNA (cytidine(1402)-2'-O)-methyltransferase [Patescibacteria group bacterium]|jgi:16S rRNA (cytidine1402-2'-O)-methyltransferase
MGILYIVATPIGNLDDITLRALKTLKQADFIACEDTRQTAKLLQKHSINKPLISYHQHSKLTRIDYIINLLKEGKTIALVSDAGTPAVSDPGSILVSKAIDNNITVSPIPGPCAAICAWQAAGLASHQFTYYGFLPNKKGRQTMLKKILNEDKPVIVYESCHRINKLLSELGETQVIVAKELTKIHETFFRGKANEIKIEVPKGEYVVLIPDTAEPQPHG